MVMMKRMMMMIIDFSHPKSTGRGAAENEVSCLEQVEVVAHVVHHIPDQDHSHVIDLDFCDVDDRDQNDNNSTNFQARRPRFCMVNHLDISYRWSQ